MAKTPVIQQPPFDKRILKIQTPGAGNPDQSGGGVEKLGWNSTPTASAIRRGFMKQQYATTPNGNPLTFQYLYNPSTVNANYEVQLTDSGLAAMFPTAGDQGNLAVPTNNSASWTIMFDRTYELWGSYDPKGNCLHKNNEWGNNPKVVGCWADILQLQWFTGMWTSASKVTTNTINGGIVTTGANTYGANVPTGPMYAVMCWAFFGTLVGTFYGAITGWDYTITHYNQFMVPMRCVIDINFTMYPNPGASAKANTGATSIPKGKQAVYDPTQYGYIGARPGVFGP